MKVGDVVRLKEGYQIKGVDYGIGIIVDVTEYPEEGFVSHKVQWKDDFSFHAAHELETISQA